MPTLVEERAERDVEFNKRVGANIRAVREKHGMTQLKLAEYADMDPSHISRVESGDRGLSLAQGIRIAASFGLSPVDLLRTDYTDPRAWEGKRARTLERP